MKQIPRRTANSAEFNCPRKTTTDIARDELLCGCPIRRITCLARPSVPYVLEFQLFTISGHFRAAQTLTFDSMWLPIHAVKNSIYRIQFVSVSVLENG